MATTGVLAYLLLPGHGLAPNPGLRQLDLLHLGEPAPGLETRRAARPTAVVVFCEMACELPLLAP